MAQWPHFHHNIIFEVSANMPLIYRISPSGHHVRIVGTGTLTTRDCITLIRRVLSDTHRAPDASAFVDLRDATYNPMNLEDVITIAREVRAFHSRIRNNVAIVARRSTLFLAELLSEAIRKTFDLSIRVFVDASAARAYCRNSPTTRPSHATQPAGLRGASAHPLRNSKPPQADSPSPSRLRRR